MILRCRFFRRRIFFSPLVFAKQYFFVPKTFFFAFGDNCERQRETCSNQPGHPSSLIRVFAIRMKKSWVLSYPLSAQQRFRSDWADIQADPSLQWAHRSFCWFCHAVVQFLFFSWETNLTEKQIQWVLMMIKD